jgi:hypothetical protein
MVPVSSPASAYSPDVRLTVRLQRAVPSSYSVGSSETAGGSRPLPIRGITVFSRESFTCVRPARR